MQRHRNWLHACAASLIGLTLLVAFALALDGEGTHAAAEASVHADEPYPRPYAEVASSSTVRAKTSSQQTMWFQYEVSPSQEYTGVEDTYLDGEPTHELDTHGMDPGMKVSAPGRMRPLIRFDLLQIEPWAEVGQATLSLHATNYSQRPALGFDVTVYKVVRPWDEMQASWLVASAAGMWGVAGADNSSDRSFAPAASTHVLEIERIYTWDITALVQDWVSNPSENYGMILVGSGTGLDARRSFWTSQHQSAPQRPELMVVYNVNPDVTPAPTSTPTMKLTPTAGPTPTPTPRSVLTSTASGCLCAGQKCEDAGWPSGEDVWLAWEGEPVWARLHLDEASVRSANTILVNGHVVGTSEPWQEGAGSYCSATHPVMLEIDPGILAPGYNSIEITDDQEASSWGDKVWTATNARLEIAGDLDAPRYDHLVVTSTFDGHPQLAMAQVPVSYTGNEDVPLLIALPWWSAPPSAAVYAKALEANARGWLLAAPSLRGQHTASLPVQHDIIDLVNVMTDTYRVDPSRIYLTGPSMGGMIAATTAAKYPDVFAAVVMEKGPTDLKKWHEECWADPSQRHHVYTIELEIGYPPTVNSFEYQRRSSQSMAMNLAHVPIAILHGTSDEVVYPHHAQDLYDAIGPLYPWEDCSYDAKRHTCLCWYEGDHGTPLPYGAEWVFDFLSTYTLNDNPLDLKIRTDETKSYYWLHITQTGSIPYWTYVEARYDPLTSIISASVSDGRYSGVEIGFDLNRMGLDTGVSYTVEDYDLTGGDYSLSVVAPVDGILTIPVPDVNQHRFDIYPDVASTVTTLVYQQGLEGYSGVEDTYLYGYDEDENYHESQTLMLRYNSFYTPLMRFELSDVPQNAVVKSALLRLYITGRSNDRVLEAAAHKMLRPWVVDEATWNHARAGAEWNGAGASGSEDREDTYAGVVTLDADEGWVTLNVRSLSQDWVASPETNYGLTLKGSGAPNFYYLASSDRLGWESWRPELTIKYTMPTPTPSATNTPTITPTPTATASPTPTATDIPQYGYAEGYVWNDIDEDGQLDTGEQMLARAIIIVTDAIGQEVASAETAADGIYYLQLPAPATYRVTEYDPPGYSSTTESTWEEHLMPGGSIKKDFGARPMPWFLPMIVK